MILKTLTHDRGSFDCWNYYDNIEFVSVFYSEELKQTCAAITFKGADDEVVIAIDNLAYLCNDFGRTIDRLGPPRNPVDREFKE